MIIYYIIIPRILNRNYITILITIYPYFFFFFSFRNNNGDICCIIISTYSLFVIMMCLSLLLRTTNKKVANNNNNNTLHYRYYCCDLHTRSTLHFVVWTRQTQATRPKPNRTNESKWIFLG